MIGYFKYADADTPELYRKNLYIDKLTREAWSNIGLGDFDLAQRKLNKLVQYDPNNYWINYGMSHVLASSCMYKGV